MPIQKGDRVKLISEPRMEGEVVGWRTTTGFVKVLWDGRSSPQRVLAASIAKADDVICDVCNEPMSVHGPTLEHPEKRRGRMQTDWLLGGGYPEGIEFAILGPAIMVSGTSWTPILPDGDEDPTFCKTSGIVELPLTVHA